jgi:NAD(P)-dependent dehydrogenase (short-subunit alcohol dehydrogenase family)
LKSFGPNFRALVIGASGGIGSALLQVLRGDRQCVEAVGLSRSQNGLDLRDESSIAQCAGNAGPKPFDLIICATGALTINGARPEKSIKQISAETMAAQFAINAIGPALVIKHFSPLLVDAKRSAFAVLSARIGSIGDNRLGGWISYRSSKAALNQIVRTSSIEIGRLRPKAIMIAIHPGTVSTALSEPYSANYQSTNPRSAALSMLATIDGLQDTDTGCFFAYDGTSIDW